ncbi:hypothetical protein COCVIDRAFT_107491 [Bipolaris victoriae FI3]|uniref:Uncharacterized protein n=1 Tax=Bipolaris victoriae (strain FI3) TaxID=930091 RepID=W7EDG7_BIPV3|nr:hypothetical protein COCVIDRAFT_107491 [Bipolaris victoriae FI3]
MRFSITLLLAAAVAVVAQDTVSAPSSDCEPHGDHWHCADGVPEPTTPPTPEQLASFSAAEAAEDSTPASAIASRTSSGSVLVTPSSTHSHDDDDHDHDDDDHVATASTCEPHGDHWHCPSGVAEPTAPPAAATGNAASQIGAGQVVALIGAAAYFL